ncbi:MAG: hypothetical protein ABH885_02395, partial [Candidatus Omnitrophota bacterium]
MNETGAATSELRSCLAIPNFLQRARIDTPSGKPQIPEEPAVSFIAGCVARGLAEGLSAEALNDLVGDLVTDRMDSRILASLDIRNGRYENGVYSIPNSEGTREFCFSHEAAGADWIFSSAGTTMGVRVINISGRRSGAAESRLRRNLARYESMFGTSFRQKLCGLYAYMVSVNLDSPGYVFKGSDIAAHFGKGNYRRHIRLLMQHLVRWELIARPDSHGDGFFVVAPIGIKKYSQILSAIERQCPETFSRDTYGQVRLFYENSILPITGESADYARKGHNRRSRDGFRGKYDDPRRKKRDAGTRLDMSEGKSSLVVSRVERVMNHGYLDVSEEKLSLIVSKVERAMNYTFKDKHLVRDCLCDRGWLTPKGTARMFGERALSYLLRQHIMDRFAGASAGNIQNILEKVLSRQRRNLTIGSLVPQTEGLLAEIFRDYHGLGYHYGYTMSNLASELLGCIMLDSPGIRSALNHIRPMAVSFFEKAADADPVKDIINDIPDRTHHRPLTDLSSYDVDGIGAFRHIVSVGLGKPATDNMVEESLKQGLIPGSFEKTDLMFGSLRVAMIGDAVIDLAVMARLYRKFGANFPVRMYEGMKKNLISNETMERIIRGIIEKDGFPVVQPMTTRYWANLFESLAGGVYRAHENAGLDGIEAVSDFVANLYVYHRRRLRREFIEQPMLHYLDMAMGYGSGSARYNLPIRRVGPQFSEEGEGIIRFMVSDLSDSANVSRIAGVIASHAGGVDGSEIAALTTRLYEYYTSRFFTNTYGDTLVNTLSIDIRKNLAGPAVFDRCSATIFLDVDLLSCVPREDLVTFLAFVVGHEGQHYYSDEPGAESADRERFTGWSIERRQSVINALQALNSNESYSVDKGFLHRHMAVHAEEIRHGAPAQGHDGKRRFYLRSIDLCNTILSQNPALIDEIDAANCSGYAANEVSRMDLDDIRRMFADATPCNEPILALYNTACRRIRQHAMARFNTIIQRKSPNGVTEPRGLKRAIAGYAFSVTLLADLGLQIMRIKPTEERGEISDRLLMNYALSVRNLTRGFRMDRGNDHIQRAFQETMGTLKGLAESLEDADGPAAAKRRQPILAAISTALAEAGSLDGLIRSDNDRIDDCIEIIDRRLYRVNAVVDAVDNLASEFLAATQDRELRRAADFDDVLELRLYDRYPDYEGFLVPIIRQWRQSGKFDDLDVLILMVIGSGDESQSWETAYLQRSIREIDPETGISVDEMRIRFSRHRYRWLGLEPVLVDTPPVPQVAEKLSSRIAGGNAVAMERLHREHEALIARLQPWLNESHRNGINDRMRLAMTSLSNFKKAIAEGQAGTRGRYHDTAGLENRLGTSYRTLKIAMERLIRLIRLRTDEGPRALIEHLRSHISSLKDKVRHVRSEHDTVETRAAEDRLREMRAEAQSLLDSGSPAYLSIETYRAILMETGLSNGDTEGMGDLASDVADMEARAGMCRPCLTRIKALREKISESGMATPDTETA